MDTFRSGLFLLKENYFPFDSKLNVRHILEKTGTFLQNYRVNGRYASRIIIDRCAYHGIDARIVLCLLQIGSGLLSRKDEPSNENTINLCLGLKPRHVPEENSDRRTWGLEKQVDLALILLKRFYGEAGSNVGVPIMVDGKELVPINASTYAICSVIWIMGGGFGDIIRFRKVYKELFQTKEHDSRPDSSTETTGHSPESTSGVPPPGH